MPLAQPPSTKGDSSMPSDTARSPKAKRCPSKVKPRKAKADQRMTSDLNRLSTDQFPSPRADTRSAATTRFLSPAPPFPLYSARRPHRQPLRGMDAPPVSSNRNMGEASMPRTSDRPHTAPREDACDPRIRTNHKRPSASVPRFVVIAKPCQAIPLNSTACGIPQTVALGDDASLRSSLAMSCNR